MIRFTKKEQNQLDKLNQKLKKNTQVDSAASVANYIDKYADTGKFFKGKWRRWDKRTKTWYDAKATRAYLNKQEYGTFTPKADVKYLQALKLQAQRESGVQYRDPTRIKLSRKLEGEPFGTVYEKEQAARRNKDRAQLAKLRKNSSFVERNFGSNYAEQEKSLFIAAGDAAQVPGSDAYKEAVQKNQGTKRGNVQNPEMKRVEGEISTKESTPPGREKSPATARETLLINDLKKLYGEAGFSQSRNSVQNTKRKLQIMRKEQELWNQQRPNEPYPSLTGRNPLQINKNGG